MSLGARKITLRPCKIVGLMRKLDRLSRRYKAEKKSEGTNLESTKADFNNSLLEIKERLKGFGRCKKLNQPKILQPKIRKRNRFIPNKKKNRLKNPKIV